MTAAKILDRLITMSRVLGDPALDYAILGEGNTSAKIDGDTFWVKASGAEMRIIEAGGSRRTGDSSTCPTVFFVGFRWVWTGKEKGPSCDGPQLGYFSPVVVMGWMTGVEHPVAKRV